MINPLADSFMIATRTRHSAYWENEHFANVRDRELRPRLLAAPKVNRTPAKAPGIAPKTQRPLFRLPRLTGIRLFGRRAEAGLRGL